MNVRLGLIATIAIATSTVAAQSIPRTVPTLPPNNLPAASPINVEKYGTNPAANISLDWKEPSFVEVKSSVFSGSATLLLLGTQKIDVVLDKTTRLLVNPQIVLVLPGVAPNSRVQVPLPVQRLLPATPVYAQAIAVIAQGGRLSTESSNGLKLELQEITIGGKKSGNSALPEPVAFPSKPVPVYNK